MRNVERMHKQMYNSDQIKKVVQPTTATLSLLQPFTYKVHSAEADLKQQRMQENQEQRRMLQDFPPTATAASTTPKMHSFFRVLD